MSSKISRITCSLPTSMVEDIDLIARSFRVTRSALLSQLLSEATAGLRYICEQHVLPLSESTGNRRETERAISETLDRLAVELEVARGSYAKSTKH